MIAPTMNLFAHLLHGATAASGLKPTEVLGLRSLLNWEESRAYSIDGSIFFDFSSMLFTVHRVTIAPTLFTQGVHFAPENIHCISMRYRRAMVKSRKKDLDGSEA